MSDTQRTGNFTVATHLEPEAEAPQLQALFHRIGMLIQKATNDGRAYTFKVKIVTNITIQPWEAEIGEYVPTDYFNPNLGTQDQVLRNPNDPTMKYRVFQPTPQGYQRIE